MVEQKAQTQKHNPQGFGYRLLELKSLGLDPQDARKLLILLAKWKKHRGIRGAIAYCNALEARAKANLNGDPEPKTEVWVAKCKEGFPPSLKFLRKYSSSLRRRMVPLKRLFHVDAFDSVNIKKFVSTCEVEDDGSYEESLKPVRALIKLGVDFCKRELTMPSFTTFTKDVVDFPELVYQKHCAKGERGDDLNRKIALHILRDMQHIAYSSNLRRNIYVDAALRKFKIPLGIDELLNSLFNSHSEIADKAWNVGDPHRFTVGGVFGSSEPGMKLRVFASPRLIFQAALQPLFKVLMAALEVLPSDCTTCQEEGALWAQREMLSGKIVHSVDTQAATDSFPYALQRFVLNEHRVCHQMLSLLDHCVEGQWVTPKSFRMGNATVKWTRGQPLGLQPSFALYAYTHNLLLIGICEKFGISKDCFRILGDDIVISDDIVHREYRKALKLMKVGISEMKSFSSSSYAEFAGYYITPDELIRAGKFRPLNPENLLSKITDPRTVFPEVLVPKRIRKRLKALLEQEFPKGFLPLKDEKVRTLSDDELYELIEILFQNLMDRSVHIETETWRCLKFNFDPILAKGYTDTQVHVERFLERNPLPEVCESDLLDINRFRIANMNVVPFQYDLFVLFSRIAYHVLVMGHKDSLQLAAEIPLLRDLKGGMSRMEILKHLQTKLPVGRPMSQVDGWSVLLKLHRGMDAKEVLSTPKTIIRHWKRESSPLYIG